MEAVYLAGATEIGSNQRELLSCVGRLSFLTPPPPPTRTLYMSFLHRSIEPMGRLTVQVVVRSWGLVGLPSTLTVNVDDDVSEGGFQVRGCFFCARVVW